MRSRRTLALSTLAVGFALAACQQGPDLSSDADTSPVAAGQTYNEHGNVSAMIGTPTQVTDVSLVDDPAHVANVTITSVAVDDFTACGEIADLGGPSRGHVIAVNFHLETTAEVDGTWMLNPLELSVIGADGNTESWKAAMFDCGGQAPPTLGPSQAADAVVVLDTAYTSGAIQYRPLLADNGWEWSF